MPFPLSIHAQEKQRARTGLVVLASTFLAAVALLAFLNEYSEPALQIDALELKDGFTVAQIGQYGMRADRQARNFELDAERRIDQATALRTKSSDTDAASAQLEKNARQSAFLAADQKSQIKQLISVGKDQVTRAVQYNAHASKLRQQAKSLMGNALDHLKTSEMDEKRYNINLDKYSKVVSRIHELEAVGDGVITKLHEAGLNLAAVAQRYMAASSAKKPDAKAVAKLKASLDAAQEAVAKLTQEQVLADTDVQKAKLLMDKYQPLIEKADRLKYDSVQEYAAYANLKTRSASLESKAASISSRADNLKELLANSMSELKHLRAAYWHYKKRSQAEMNAANAAEAKTEALRKAARSVEHISATLQSKADTIRQLSQQGVHKALIDAEQKEMGSQ
jgi:hypothetical protein